jgi:isopenicillin N synthase-like dioxygenase
MTNPFSSTEDKARLVADIRAACSHVGFFVIKNHGIECRIVDDAFDGLKESFDLLMEKKKGGSLEHLGFSLGI